MSKIVFYKIRIIVPNLLAPPILHPVPVWANGQHVYLSNSQLFHQPVDFLSNYYFPWTQDALFRLAYHNPCHKDSTWMKARWEFLLTFHLSFLQLLSRFHTSRYKRKRESTIQSDWRITKLIYFELIFSLIFTTPFHIPRDIVQWLLRDIIQCYNAVRAGNKDIRAYIQLHDWLHYWTRSLPLLFPFNGML